MCQVDKLTGTVSLAINWNSNGTWSKFAPQEHRGGGFWKQNYLSDDKLVLGLFSVLTFTQTNYSLHSCCFQDSTYTWQVLSDYVSNFSGEEFSYEFSLRLIFFTIKIHVFMI